MIAAAPAAGRTVLVTGAGGFIGSHLAADRLARGNGVVALDLDLERVRHLEAPAFKCVEGDVADPLVRERVVEGIDTVFHLAAAHLSVRAGEADYRRVNVEAVRGLIEACERAGVRRFVHCSTVGVFGRIEKPPADEETPCNPEIPYERTKLEGEGVVLQAARARDFPATVIRPTWVYGPGCRRTEKLFRSIGRGRFVIAGGGDKLRHCVYIRDMVDAFDLAADSDRAVGQVVIVADEHATSVRELVSQVASLTEAPRPRSVPVAALWVVGAGAEIASRVVRREPPLSRRSLKFFTGNTSFLIDRARSLLGFRPRYSLSSGLSETYRHLRSGSFWTVPLPDFEGELEDRVAAVTAS